MPSARRPGLPPQLDKVTARLLAKDPTARPAGAAAARAELLAAQAPDTTAVLPAPRDGGGPAPPGSHRRRPASRAEIALAAALAALAAVLVTGAAALRAALGAS